ncbi:MAG TPA: hypothetical protein VL974_15280 [Magnetospirillum sp.]|jgi:hypothetical protein|nr:hypothetical protein [Magnetospirillum sp.]
MRLPILALVATLVAMPAIAQVPCRSADGLPEPETAPAAVPQPNQFHRVIGKGLGCAVSQTEGEAMASHKQPVTFLPCLRVGAVGVADERATVEELLGEPTQIRDLDLRTQARVYPIHQRSIPEPYYVVTYQDDVAVAVQLIGPPTEMPARFSGLSLGDSARKTIEALGKPTRRCMLRAKGPETWMWQPFPIGVDVLDGKVVGFKVTWPAGRPTPE